MTGRNQKTKINGLFSKPAEVVIGVPQGTVLGPILFLIYINDLCNLTIPGKICSYADDTAIVISQPSWQKTFKCGNQSMQKVYAWLNENLLTLNASKTVYLTFSASKSGQPHENHKIKLHTENCNAWETNNCDCITLERSTYIKYLGIYIDNKLKWVKQMSELHKKLRKLIYIFTRIRNALNLSQLKTTYFAIIQSVLQYGIAGWGGILDTHLVPITTIQKTILKIILKKPRWYPTSKVFLDIQVFDPRQLYIKTCLIHLYKTYCNQKVTRNIQQTRNNSIIALPKRNNQIGQRHLDYIGTRSFNMLPLDTRNISSLTLLKLYVKKWILSKPKDFCSQLVNLAI